MDKFELTAEEFRAIRQECGLSQKQLQNILGINSRSTLCNMEKGHARIPTPTGLCMVMLDMGVLLPTLDSWLAKCEATGDE